MSEIDEVLQAHKDRITDLEALISLLTTRVKDLETVVAGALPNFNSDTIAGHINKKKEEDFQELKMKLFQDAYLVGSFTQENYGHSLNLSLSIGGKMIPSTIPMKKPQVVVTFTN